MSDAIQVKQLRKEFKSASSRSGLKGAFRDLLTRNYKVVPAVNDINFTVKKGEMVAYIGENGAGEITVNGMNPHKEREKFTQTIGVVFGQRSQLWWDIAVQESFRLLKKVYKVTDEQYNDHMEHVIKTLDIGPLLDKPVRKLSLGQRMRCELAAALIHNPPLLFLDEPTIGLDVLVKMKIREFLKEINEKYNTTILLTTHDLGDIEALCERVIMLDEGQIIYDGELQSLKDNWAEEKQIHFQFIEPIALKELQSLALPFTANWVHDEKNQTYIALLKEESDHISQLVSAVVSHFKIKDIKIHETSIEEIVRNIYEEGTV
jgi:ABC-2 type transport system ATP-binding protein